MEDKKGFLYWFTAALAVSLAFFLVKDFNDVIRLEVVAQGISLELRHFTSELPKPSFGPKRQGAFTTTRPPRPESTERVQVPGKSEEECLAQSKGVVNEQYARCRSGYVINCEGSSCRP